MTACPQSVYTPTRLQVALHDTQKNYSLVREIFQKTALNQL